MDDQHYTPLPPWLRMIFAGAAGVVAVGGALTILSPYLPMATKDYVDQAIAARIGPLAHQQQLADNQLAALQGNLAGLSDVSLTYEIIQMQAMVNKLQTGIADGSATISDQQLYATLKETITKATALRDRAESGN